MPRLLPTLFFPSEHHQITIFWRPSLRYKWLLHSRWPQAKFCQGHAFFFLLSSFLTTLIAIKQLTLLYFLARLLLLFFFFCFLLAKSWKGIKGIAGVAAGAAVRIIVIRSCFNIFLSFYRLLEFVRAGISLELLKGRSRWIRRCSHVLIMLPLDNLRSSAIFKEPPC